MDSALEREEYHMEISSYHIEIRGGGKAGVFYGIQTLLQMLTDEMSPPYQIPCIHIHDYPRFTWRGMHLDVSRHFFPKEFVFRYIDFLAMYKMNTFHWHLTDDQGWRIEITRVSSAH
jgi:hexosaminidase